MSSSTFATPTIDTLIDGLDPKIGDSARRRLQQGKEILAIGLDANSIYNTDFNDAKDSITRSVERVWDDLSYAIRTPYRENRDSIEFKLLWEILPTSIQLNNVPGYLRKIEPHVTTVPELGTVVSLLKELVPIAKAFAALKPVVIKGRKPLENPKPVDLSNTGICAICQQRFKLTAGKKLVHHGFQISDGRGHYFGFRNGSCFGTGRTPYELSNEANSLYVKWLENQIERRNQEIADLRADKPESLWRTEIKRENGKRVEIRVQYERGTTEYDQIRQADIAQALWQIKGLEMEIERQQLLIKSWELKPLYGEAV